MLTPFSPPPGIVSNDTTFKEEGRWADGNNVRFWNGSPQVVGGYIAQASPSTGVKCVALNTYRTLAGVTYVAYGMDSALHTNTGTAAPSDITPAGLGSGYNYWSLQPWGQTLLAVPEKGTLYQATAGGGAAVAIAAAPAQIAYMLVAPQQRQCIAFGCNETVSGNFNGVCIRGCDIGNLTSWTPTSTNNAFEDILDSDSAIIAARQVGRYIAVWTSTALFLGQYIGNPGQTWRWDKIDDNCGLSGPNAVTVVDGVAYWVSPDYSIKKWAPGMLPADIPCPISRDFVTHIASLDPKRIIVASVRRYSEIWIHYPDNRDAGGSSNIIPTRYIAFSLLDGAWFKGQLTLTAVMDGAAYRATTPAFAQPGSYMIANGSNIYMRETGSGAGGAALSWFLQSADQYIDASQKEMMFRGIIPDFKEQTGDVNVTLYCRNRPQSTAVTKGPYLLTTTTTKKNFRANGKVVAVKFSDSAALNSYVRIGKPLFDVTPLGDRI